MDHADRLRSALAGVGCTACGTVLRAAGVRVLAERDGLAFLGLDCAACGSSTLGMLTWPDADGTPSPSLDVARWGEWGPRDEARLDGGRPLGADDVLAMHRFLAGYRGGLRRLFDEAGRDPMDGLGAG